MIIYQVLLCLLSIVGYYFVKKEPLYAYVVFILQNLIAFLITNQWYMILNIFACIYFGNQLIKKYEIEKEK